MIKKAISLLLAFGVCISPITAGAIPYDEYMSGRYEYTGATYEISPGLTYTETLTENAKYGYERSYIYEYTPAMGTKIIPAYGDYIYGTATLGSITKTLEAEGQRVVGGVNGDFYIMETGVPLGAMIVDGEIMTSDSGYAALGFDADGRAFISKPSMVTKLVGNDYEISVGHINKTPYEYSLYLLTDKFAATTKSTKAASEFVLIPYTEVEIIATEEDMPKEDNQSPEEEKETEKIDGASDSETSDNTKKETEEKAEKKYIYVYPETHQAEQPAEDTSAVSDVNDAESAENSNDADAVPLTGTEEQKPNESTDNEGSAASESAPEAETETETETESEQDPGYYAKRYTVSDELLTVGSEIKVVVGEIRRDVTNTEIPEGCFVLSAENTYQSYLVHGVSVGDELTLSVTANEEWYDAVNAVGLYGGYILKDGEWLDDVEVDHYAYANPRTAVGVTEEGKVIFYCVDGRQESSGGLRIDQLSHEMKNLGCVTAVNLDGGGSTTVYAALPGEKNSTLKNSPSGSVERRTANSLIFVNTTSPLGKAEKYTIYPESPYVLAGGSSYELPKPKATDENFHPIDLPDDLVYEYFIKDADTDSAITDGRIFVSGEKAGAVDIYVRIGEGDEAAEYRAGSVFVLETPQDFTIAELEEYTISPFEEIQLSFAARYHTAEIFYDKSSLRWILPGEYVLQPSETAEGAENVIDIPSEEHITQPPEIILPVEPAPEPVPMETVTEPVTDNTVGADESEEEAQIEEGTEEEKIYVQIPVDGVLETDKMILTDDLVITPKIHGETLEISAKVGELVKKYTVHVAEFPYTDSFTHWSAKNLYEIYSYHLMQGEPDGDGLAFRPDRNLTKAEFLTVLARMMYPDIDTAKAAEQEDAQVPSEQTVEVEEATSETESEVPAESSEPTSLFADQSAIPEWSKKYIDALSASGLLELIAASDENGAVVLRPNDYITRREVLVVLGALCEEAKADFVSAFIDGDVLFGAEHYDFINNAVSMGIFEGYEDGTLRPFNNLTRAEAATVLLRFYDNTFFAV